MIDPPAGPAPAADTKSQRSSRRLDRYVGLVLVAFGAFTLGPSLLGSRTLLSVNLLSTYLPWRASGLTVAGHQVCTTDTVDSVLPGIAYARSQLFSGHLGSWQSLVAGGAPLSSVPNLGLLNPLSLPYYLLPLWLAPVFVMLLQMIAAIGGTVLFLRRLCVSRAAGLLAGLIYASSGFMVMWSNWPQTRTAAFIPLMLWSVERLIQRRQFTDSLVVALVVAAILFGGFPQVAGFGLYLAGAYLLVRLVILHRGRPRDAGRAVWLALLGLGLGTGLTMVQMLPFVSQLQSTDLGYRASGTLGLPVSSLITMVAPNVFGSCIYGRPVHGSTNPVELIAFVGAAALVLAVAGTASGLSKPGRANRGARGYFVGAVIVVVLLGWVSLSLREVAVHLPVFSGNFIGRIRVLLGFAIAVLAGFGFQNLIDVAGARRDRANSLEREAVGAKPEPAASRSLQRTLLTPRRWAGFVWACAGLGTIGALVFAHRAAGGSLPSVQHDLIVPGVLGLLAVLAVLAARSRVGGLRITALLALPVLVAVQSASFFHTILPGDSPSEFYPVTAAHQFLKADLGHERYGASGTMFPATSLYYGLRTPTGHSFYETQWRTLLTAIDPKVMQSPTNAAFTDALNQNTIGRSPLLDRMAVKYFVLPPDEVAGTHPAVPAGTGVLAVKPNSSASCQLASQPLRGVSIQLTNALVPASSNAGMTFSLTVRDGTQTISSGLFVAGELAAGAVVSLPVAGEGLPGVGQLTVTVSLHGATTPMSVSAVSDVMACAPITPSQDGLKLVYADPSAIVYQRLDAMPRIRWASAIDVITDPRQQMLALKQGLASDTVVLSQAGPQASGRSARIAVTTDNGGHIAARVDASGAGYLVVADAMQQPGWSVMIDGEPARMVAADSAMSAVYVPTGEHVVSFTYRAPGQRLGAALSGATALAMLGLFLWDRRRRRHGQLPESPRQRPG